MTSESEWIKHFRPEPPPHDRVETKSMGPLILGMRITMIGMIVFMAGMVAIHLGWVFDLVRSDGLVIEAYPRLIILGLIGHGLGMAAILIGSVCCFVGPRRAGEVVPAVFTVLFTLMAVAILGYGLVLTDMLGRTELGDALYAFAALLASEALVFLALAGQLILISNLAADQRRTRSAMSARIFMLFWLLSPCLAYLWIRMAWEYLIVGEHDPSSGMQIIAGGIGLLALVDVIWFVCVGIKAVRCISKRGHDGHYGPAG